MLKKKILRVNSNNEVSVESTRVVIMIVKIHLRILIYATIIWVSFFLAGMPDYYLQYSTNSIILYEILLLIPFSVIIWFIFRRVKSSRHKNQIILMVLFLLFYCSIVNLRLVFIVVFILGMDLNLFMYSGF